MLSFHLIIMQSFSVSLGKVNVIDKLMIVVLALVISGCGGGSGQQQPFAVPSSVNASGTSVSESSRALVSSLSKNSSSISAVSSVSLSSSVSNSSSLISKSSNTSSASSSNSNSSANLSSSSLPISSASTSLSSSLKTSSSVNSSSSHSSIFSVSSSLSSVNNSISSFSSSISSVSSASSFNSSSQASSNFALSDIHFQLQSPGNPTSDSATPIFSVSNVDAGDSVILFSSTQCNAGDEFGRSLAASNFVSVSLTKPLSFGVYTFYISVKKSLQATSSCLPLSVTYTFIPSVASYINVKDYGAKGDGINDDTQEINAAFVAAKALGKSIYFPAGTYVCNEKSSPDNNSLILNAGGLNNIAIFGDGDLSHITSSIHTKVTLMYIYAYAKSASLHIFNLKLSNTHSPAPAEYQYGLFLQGTAGQNFSGVQIANTTFSGFGGALQGQGINGLEINHNKFLSPRGHDESMYGSTPAVNIWLFENQNGRCEDVKIHHNVADGFSSDIDINSTVSKRAMDGFVYGYAYGMDIYENTTQNFIEEHYAIAFPVLQPQTTAKINIRNNFINAAIKAGSQLDNGSAKKSNYGIRSDASHVTIDSNVITDYTLGILVRTFDNPAIAAKDIVIKNNQLLSAADANLYTMYSGIYLIGNATYPLDNLDISRNSITMNISPALQVYNAFLISNTANSRVDSNDIKQGFVKASSNQLIGRDYSKVTNITDSNNSILGGDILPFKKLPGDTISFQ